MRGKVQPERDVQDAARITPACAGKRARPSPCRSQSRDHPRACGEKCWILSSNTPLMGSPPRMRGKAFGLVLYKVEIGITSACAGKSKHKWAVSNFRWDHPRVCGEKLRIVEVGRVKEGSPPHVRGKALNFGVFPFQKGITPRVCGEKLEGFKETARQLGSPPRMRGKELLAADDLQTLRITPACAGKSPNGPQ